MYTAELAWFELDLPDHVSLEAHVASPSPLFSNMRVGTRWTADLGRFRLYAAIDAVDGMDDFSRAAFEAGKPADPLTVNGVPGLRTGGYATDRSRTAWRFSLNGLTLALTLESESGQTLTPTDAERAEHAAIIGSVRRVSRT
ncbi:MAG: hypothetical protein WBG08_11395 [Litorimonas sp.]